MKPTLKLLDHPSLPSIRTIGFCAQRFPDYQSIDRELHQHDVVEIFLVLHGHGTHLMEDAELPLSPGDSGIVHFGQSHAIITHGEMMDIINLYIDPSLAGLPTLPPPLGPALPRILPLAPGLAHRLNRVQQYPMDNPARLASLLLAMVDEASGRDVGNLDAMRSYLRLVLLEYARFSHRQYGSAMQEHSGPEIAVERIRRHLDERWEDPVDLEVLAKRARLSKAHLCRIFRKHTGRTIVEYVHQRRIEQAMMLLHGSSEKIIAIAHAAGFSDLAHFNRIFRRIAGTTPSDFRARR